MKTKFYLLMPLLFVSLLSSCNKSTQNNWWNHTDSLTEADVGKIETITINKQKHRVRLIGIDHDDLADGTGKAHTTWEFVDLLSDTNGHSLSTPWYWEDGGSSNSLNFINSNVRKALDGKGDGKLYWYEKASRTVSTTYTKPVIDMLPQRLRLKLKNVTKSTVLGLEDDEFRISTYSTQVFILSCQEQLRHLGPDMPIGEGKVYKYYYDNDTIVARGKKQVNRSDYFSSGTYIIDGKCNASNYSGVNYEAEVFNGWWTRSPSAIDNIDYSCIYECDGFINDETSCVEVYSSTKPVVPAFCI